MDTAPVETGGEENMTTRKGVALTIGLNAVDPGHYAGWSGELVACEADAHDMARIAAHKGFKVATLLTRQVTRSALTKALGVAAAALAPGDIFMLSYSGHGGQLPDLNGDEADGLDETWCLWDGEWVDDELYKAFGAFKRGVRILVFSDSCHSGSVVKARYYGERPAAPAAPQPARYRAMPPDAAARTFHQNRELYEPILRAADLATSRAAVKASVLLISGCQDNQFSADGAFNGLFTGTLLQVWNGGKFKGSYSRFHRAIADRMPPDQSPNYFTVGLRSRTFERQKPFTI